MVSKGQITVGELSSFLVYAAFVGVSFGGGRMLERYRGAEKRKGGVGEKRGMRGGMAIAY